MGADTAQVARQMYALVGAWLDRARRLAETPSTTLDFRQPSLHAFAGDAADRDAQPELIRRIL